MIYLVQLVYVHSGEEQAFNEFEERVLPLVRDHEGELLLRLRPAEACVIEASVEVPYEIHVLRFGSEDALDRYSRDPTRQRFLELRNRSVRATLVVKQALESAALLPPPAPAGA